MNIWVGTSQGTLDIALLFYAQCQEMQDESLVAIPEIRNQRSITLTFEDGADSLPYNGFMRGAAWK